MATDTALHEQILRRLIDAGYEAFYVGGYVRDTLLNLPAKDIDITTNATPDQVVRMFPNSERVGAHFGVVLVKGADTPNTSIALVKGAKTTIEVAKGENPIEVATFRTDGAYEEGVGHPEKAVFTHSFIWDVQHRDFTINALAMDDKGAICDCVGGRTDLKDKLIRAVGDPCDRFDEDPLRMMRAVRFACQLKFRIVDSTLAGIKSKARRIQEISPERIQQELNRILTSGKSAYGVRLLVESHLMLSILPEFTKLLDTEQDALHHPEGNVFNHTLGLLVRLKKGCSLTLALAVLLHDIGKPATLGEKNGQPTFHGHEEVGAEMTRKILNRLKYPTEVIDTVVHHVAQHMHFRLAPEMRKAKLYRFLGQDNFAELLELHKLDAQAGSCNMANAEFVERVLAEVPPAVIKPERLLTGKDLIDMGLTPGPAFRTLLDRVETEQLEGQITTREQALAFVANTLGTSQAAMERSEEISPRVQSISVVPGRSN
jgi:putative nucleotidyltransferase with HDIG domain